MSCHCPGSRHLDTSWRSPLLVLQLCRFTLSATFVDPVPPLHHSITPFSQECYGAAAYVTAWTPSIINEYGHCYVVTARRPQGECNPPTLLAGGDGYRLRQLCAPLRHFTAVYASWSGLTLQKPNVSGPPYGFTARRPCVGISVRRRLSINPQLLSSTLCHTVCYGLVRPWYTLKQR